MSQPKDGWTIPPELEAEMTPAVRAFVEVLLARISQLETDMVLLKAENARLKAQLGKTPQNSSLPPSTQHPHAKPKPRPKPSGRKPGGQPGHAKCQRPLLPSEECDHVEVLKPTHCRGCGESLCGDDTAPLRHQVWELPVIKPLVTEYQRHRLECPCCGTATTAVLPSGVPSGQTGPRLVAFAALLMAYFRQSKRRTAEFVETLLGAPCSTGLTIKHQTIATEALNSCYEELKEALPEVEAANLDETGSKEAGQRAWLWVAVTTGFTLFAVRLTRAGSVVRELLGEKFAGFLTTDRYGAYNGYSKRQICWAHLLRDFEGLIDQGKAGKRIGRRLKNVAGDLFRHWDRYRGGTITRGTMRHNIHGLMWPMWEVLEDGMHCRHAPTVTLCCDLFDRFDEMWMFLDHPDVEPTNNAAERALRHAVIWRKLSFGTQSAAGSRFVETMLSVIETCRQQDRPVLEFVTQAVTAHFANRPTPSLLHGA